MKLNFLLHPRLYPTYLWNFDILCALSVYLLLSKEYISTSLLNVDICLFRIIFVPVNDLDLTTLCYTVDEMYLASLINKGREAYISGTTNPTALPAETILKMATITGAKAVLWDNEIGSLEVGKKVMLLGW